MEKNRRPVITLITTKPIIIIILSMTILVGTVQIAQGKGAIIFRLDDVQDYYANNGTKAVMDLFAHKHVPLTLAVIADAIGNDSTVVNKTKAGLDTGLFELALHGYHHIDYTKLSAQNQSDSITTGNSIVEQVLGARPTIFVPPYNYFNTDTLSALRSHDMNIISASIAGEIKFNGRASMYNASEPCGKACINPVHISADTDFRAYANNTVKPRTMPEILGDITDDVRHYGYSIIMIHPQDFVITAPLTGKIVKNEVDQKSITELASLVDQLKARYNIVSTQGLIGKPAADPPKKIVVITLDDDWVGQYKNAVPILKKYGFNATFFVNCLGPIAQAPSFIRDKSPDITSWAQLRQIKSDGFDIENHGMTHHSLVNQGAFVLQREIVESKQCLQSQLGVNSRVYAPAYATPENNKTIDSIIASHYDFARNGYGGGRYNSPRYDLHTNSVNSFDKQFNHNTAQVLEAFAKEVSDTQLPVLVYHNIANLNDTDPAWYNSTTTPETFNAEMNWLKDNGYEVHSIADLKYDKEFKLK